jgi:hypothetical protein
MLANFFGKSKPINFIVIIGLFFTYFLIATFEVVSVGDFSGSFILKTIGIGCLFLMLFFFYNFIVSKNNLTFDNSYAFLLFVLFIGFFTTYFLDVKGVILFYFHLLFLRKTYSIQSSKTLFQKLFDAGFWLGILFILEPFSLVYFVLLYASIYIYKRITLRTLLIPIIGFVCPLILYFTYLFWYDNVEEFQQYFYFFTSYNLSLYAQNLFLIPLILMGFFTITAILLKTPKALSVKNTFRKSWLLIIFNLLIASIFIILLPEKKGVELLFILFPMSIIVANGLEVILKNSIKDLVLILLLLCSFIFPFLL